MERDAIIDRLNDLIRVAEDGHLGLQRAAEDVQDEELRQLLIDAAAERSQIIRELQLQVAAVGGAPEATGTLLGGAQRLFSGVAAALGVRGIAEILTEVASRDCQTAQRFREAIADLPPDVGQIVADLGRRIEDCCGRLEALKPEAA